MTTAPFQWPPFPERGGNALLGLPEDGLFNPGGSPGGHMGWPGSRRGRCGSPALRVSHLKAITAVQGAIQSDGLNRDSVLFHHKLTGAAKSRLQMLFICAPPSPPPAPMFDRPDPRNSPLPAFPFRQDGSPPPFCCPSKKPPPGLKCPAALMTEQTPLQSGSGQAQAVPTGCSSSAAPFRLG